ncbi:hypothetical protein VNO77_22669 [Canavalia gladiata]|uniref:Uncharacterized protein n=1 Tax=Canavalia gladiata TaxID=3824 RepID=A0AAN9L697_CANGL
MMKRRSHSQLGRGRFGPLWRLSGNSQRISEASSGTALCLSGFRYLSRILELLLAAFSNPICLLELLFIAVGEEEDLNPPRINLNWRLTWSRKSGASISPQDLQA